MKLIPLSCYVRKYLCEKLIYSGTKDLTNQKVFEKVIQNKYGKQFHITFLDLPVYTDDK